MNSKKAEALLEKYLKGETNLSEEKELKSFYSSRETPGSAEFDYFDYLNSKHAEAPLGKAFDSEIMSGIMDLQEEPTVKPLYQKYWLVAASLVLVLALGILYQSVIVKNEPVSQPVVADTFEDPERAFEETKKALLFISSRLNESNEYAAQLSKFQEGQEIIKQQEAAGIN